MQQYDDLLIDALLDEGFTLAEAERLVAFQKYADGERFDEGHIRYYRRWVESNLKNKDPDHPKH